jgi:hypothetical protein
MRNGQEERRRERKRKRNGSRERVPQVVGTTGRRKRRGGKTSKLERVGKRREDARATGEHPLFEKEKKRERKKLD